VRFMRHMTHALFAVVFAALFCAAESNAAESKKRAAVVKAFDANGDALKEGCQTEEMIPIPKYTLEDGVYFHGGASGHFEKGGKYITLRFQDQDAYNHEESFETLRRVNNGHTVFKDGRLANDDTTLTRRGD
jgi:hypothetical protein